MTTTALCSVGRMAAAASSRVARRLPWGSPLPRGFAAAAPAGPPAFAYEELFQHVAPDSTVYRKLAVPSGPTVQVRARRVTRRLCVGYADMWYRGIRVNGNVAGSLLHEQRAFC